MNKFYIFLFSFFLILGVEAKILDKIVAVVDDKIITLSMVKRIQSNLEIRRNIAPFVYSNPKLSNREIADNIINTKVIRDKLAEFGYVVSDYISQG